MELVNNKNNNRLSISIDRKISPSTRKHSTSARMNKLRANAQRLKHFSEEKPQWLRKLIERLEDKREDVEVKEIEAPLIIQRILNVTFVVLGLALFFGVIGAIIFTVGMLFNVKILWINPEYSNRNSIFRYLSRFLFNSDKILFSYYYF